MAGPADPRLVALLAGATRILIFTGAGISTGSGIPDYRGPQGVWKRRKPVYYDDFMGSEDARIEYWDFKIEGWEAIRNAQPNAVHHATVRLEGAGRLAGVVTQNIDGLHARAGTSRDRLVEIHGTDLSVACQSCGELTDPEPHMRSFQETRRPPFCPCGGVLKPATISFGQGLRSEDLRRAAEMAAKADLVIALGSTLGVYPAAGIPLAAAEAGTPYVIINQGATEHDDLQVVTLRLHGDVGELFPAAVDEALDD
ncbi:MAG: Sir2 family NAD-dependent protein deacetylase [Pseudomonadota bacterium]